MTKLSVNMNPYREAVNTMGVYNQPITKRQFVKWVRTLKFGEEMEFKLPFSASYFYSLTYKLPVARNLFATAEWGIEGMYEKNLKIITVHSADRVFVQGHPLGRNSCKGYWSIFRWGLKQLRLKTAARLQKEREKEADAMACLLEAINEKHYLG